MKKTLALILALIMTVGLFAGCGEESKSPAATPDAPTTPSTPDEPTTPATPDVPSDKPAEGDDPWTKYEFLTIAQLHALAVDSGVTTTETYYVIATVEAVTNATYGAMTLKDETGSIGVYNSKNADGSVDYANMTEKPYKGDTVLMKGTIQNFNGTKEIKQGYIIDFKAAKVEINEADYAEMSIADARKAETGKKVKVSGTVAAITYANGMIPAGIILVDKTSSIYVYDGDLAGRVAVGNTISIGASKTYWILDSEKSNADKFGYTGCNQLESPILLSNDKGNTEFDKSWMQVKSVKEIVDTPVSEDVSTLIYKTTALVKKVPGNGFVNYYINDLDGETGSYSYSQASGKDFAWLDAFDGKICTVYVAALNAKSTQSDCFWRFLPVAVVDEGFDVTTVNVAEHIVKYTGVGQFMAEYTGDPALELITSAKSELLKFEGATLSYKSSDESIVKIENNVMHCLKSGEAKITVTGSYNGKTYSQDVTVLVKIASSSESFSTVADVIAANIGDAVTVKGIVGPSLVNKTGFYLIDDSGVIAVETTEAVMETLEIGHEVILKATRGFNNKDGSAYGQTCLKEATVATNNYGSHQYSTKAFKGEISVADFYNLDINKDFTTSVYTMKANVKVEETKFYTNIYLSDGTTNVRLYCSSANQYSWLKAFAGQDVTVEIAACNWNSKDYYTGCVLSVVNPDGTRVLNNLNFQ